VKKINRNTINNLGIRLKTGILQARELNGLPYPWPDMRMSGVRICQKRVMINRNNAVFNTLPIGLPRNQMTSLEHGVIG